MPTTVRVAPTLDYHAVRQTSPTSTLKMPEDPELMPSSPTRTVALRDRAICALLDAKMTCAEIARLKIEAVLDDCPVPDHPSADTIMWYLECYLDELACVEPEAPLFTSLTGGALTLRQLQRIQAKFQDW